jgi:hypothetical protein
MTARRILIIQGHPDPDARHLCHAWRMPTPPVRSMPAMPFGG